MAKAKPDDSIQTEEEPEMVYIERIGDIIHTGITVLRQDGNFHQWAPDETKQTFVVDVETAVAAVKCGGFRVKDDSPVKLK